MRFLTAFLILLLFLPTSFAQKGNAVLKTRAKTSSSGKGTTGPFKPLDVVIQDAIEQKQCPGAVVLVGHHGRVVYKKAYGMRSLEPTREPMTLDTIFDVASLTKVVA